jgi:hypothetical protein
VVSGGLLVAGSNDGHLVALPLGCPTTGSTCRPRWTARIGQAIGRQPFATGDVVGVPLPDGRLLVFATECATTCRPLLTLRTPGPSQGAVPSGGTVLLALSGDGTVTAFTVDGRTPRPEAR